MPNSTYKLMWQGLLISIAITTVFVIWLSLRLAPESTPVSRGTSYAYSGGCIACHGQARSGFPDDASIVCGQAVRAPAHPRYEGTCDDLLAYFEVVRLKRTFSERAISRNPNRLMQGERLARQYNCFQCHGELGQGGFRNSGALKGYVPGYFGRDFAALTRGGRADSVRSWISHGIDPALFEPFVTGLIAGFFIENQAVSMPRFGTLPDSDIQLLTDYVTALHQLGKLDAKRIREYGYRTRAL